MVQTHGQIVVQITANVPDGKDRLDDMAGGGPDTDKKAGFSPISLSNRRSTDCRTENGRVSQDPGHFVDIIDAVRLSGISPA